MADSAREPAAGSLAAALGTFRARYGRLLEVLVGTLMVVLFLEVTAGVVFRMIGRSLIWYDEVASVLLAWLTFYGAALASVKRAHIGCPEIVDALPWGARRIVNILAQVVVIAFFLALGGVGVWIMPILAGDSLTSLSWVPMNFVQSVIPIASGLIVIAETAHLVELMAMKAPPDRTNGGIALADGLH